MARRSEVAALEARRFEAVRWFARGESQAAVARALGVTPQRALLTGDSLIDDFQAGANAGLTAYLLDRGGRYAAMRSVPRLTSLTDILPIVGITPNS